jgi:glycosyltransferase involved in cell wall biosynthesis
MKHVLLVVENLSLARDHRLRKQAASLVRGGYRVSVICRADPDNRTVPNVQLYEYPAPVDGSGLLGYAREYGHSLLAARRLLASVFRSDPFDALQISGTPDIYFTIAARYKRRGVRLIFDQRDLSPELYELRFGRRGIGHRVLLGLERASYRTADHVLTVNRSLETVAYERGGVPAGRVSIVRNGPSLSAIVDATPRPELRRGRRRLCCWIGVMGPQDRVDLALRSVARVVHDRGRTDTHFAFIGDGESRAELEQLARDLDLAEFVSFPGWLPPPEVNAFLATADVGLEPNLEAIVSPVKVMEYMAFGVPFVAFDLPETRALGGPAGRYVRPGDVSGFAAQLDRLLDDRERATAIGAEGMGRITHELCWERQAQTYLGVYRSLLSGSAVQPRPKLTVVAGVK